MAPTAAKAGAGRVPNLVVGAVATVLAWPPRALQMTDTLDGSWEYLITHAAGRGLHVGSGIVFTYGPLGWLFYPVAPSGAQLWLATLVVVPVFVAGFAALATLVDRCLPRPCGALLTLLAAAYVAAAVPEATAALATLVVLERLSRAPPPRPRLCLLLGVLTGVALTTKTGIGELLAGETAVVALAAGARRGGQARRGGRVRPALLAVAGAVGGFGAAWLGTGQRVGDLPGYARGSLQIQSGYQWAMVYDQFGRGWEWYPAGIGFLLLIGAAALVVVAAPRAERVRRAGAAVVAVGATYYLLLQAFVRHGGNHDVTGQLCAALVVIGWAAGAAGDLRADSSARAAAGRPVRSPGGARGTRRARTATALSVAVLVATAVASSATSFTTGQTLDRVRAARQDLTQLLHPDRRRAAQAADLAATGRAAAIPASMIATIGRHSVVPVPWDLTGPVAAGLDVVTLPVPQLYSAYTPYLDRLDARALLAPGGPEFALRQYKLAIDHRNPMWDSPLVMLALLCHYREVAAESPYQLLQRSAPRCRVSKVLETLTVAPGQRVVVPRPTSAGSGVVMSLVLPDPLVARVARRLGREPYGYEQDVGLLDAAGDGVGFRLVPATARGPLVVVAPPGLWSAGTTVGARAATVTFVTRGPVRVTFSELARAGAGTP